MGDIKRYDCGNGEGMFDGKLGEWVFYEDHKTLLEAKDIALNIDLVMLSETLEEADKEATKLDDGKSDHSLGTSQGFESGAYWVIERIKEKLHSA